MDKPMTLSEDIRSAQTVVWKDRYRGWADHVAGLEAELAVLRQRLEIVLFFPQLEYGQEGQQHHWTGILKPSEGSPNYTICIQWYLGEVPKVFVVLPAIADEAPHRYADGSLCLYDPREHQRQSDDLIARDIIPWTCEWLYWYEIWQETGKWTGPSAHEEAIALAVRLLNQDIPDDEQVVYYTKEMLIELAAEI